ncbi:hypothetical protein [Pedobacter sp. MW01-1-1]|uniref:hypothetical protein n=1 Tax=Pedobacter sp. MW01-1-1 TaxID=3383027 RepID=UPI003FEE2EE1
MKTVIVNLKMSAFALLMMLLPLGVFAQTVNAYLCGTSTAKLKAAPTGYTLVAGDKIVWTVDGTAQPAITYAVAADAEFTVNGSSLAVDNHTYSVVVTPANSNLCPSDASDATNLYKLPTLAITAANSANEYCTSNASSATVTATLGAGITLPSGVSLDYSWSATKDGVAVGTIADIGSSSSNVFTMANNTAAATYVFTATATYNTGSTTLIGSSCTATANATIKLSDKPGKPSISIVP